MTIYMHRARTIWTGDFTNRCGSKRIAPLEPFILAVETLIYDSSRCVWKRVSYAEMYLLPFEVFLHKLKNYIVFA